MYLETSKLVDPQALQQVSTTDFTLGNSLEMGFLRFAAALFFSCEGTISLKAVACSNSLSLSNKRPFPLYKSSFPYILTPP